MPESQVSPATLLAEALESTRPLSGAAPVQVKQNVQRTLAIELQKLSLAFRKQQKGYLTKLRQAAPAAGAGSFAVLDEAAPGARTGEEDLDPGFSDMQARAHVWAMHGGNSLAACKGAHVTELGPVLYPWHRAPKMRQRQARAPSRVA